MDDEQRISSNGIPYPFFSLYKNRLSDKERLQIITDSRQHTDNISIIHINGLGNIDNLIPLKKQVQVKLRKLLLSIHQTNTSNNKLFIQVERQSDPDWITAAFHLTDTELVLQCLPTLSKLIQQYVTPTSLHNVFTAPDLSLKFVTKTIPIKKGNIQITTVPVSAETQDHTTRLLKKLSSASARKRNIVPSVNTRNIQTMKSPTFMVTTIPDQTSPFTQSSLEDMQRHP